MHHDQSLVPDGHAPIARAPGEVLLHLPAVMPEPVLRLVAFREMRSWIPRATRERRHRR